MSAPALLIRLREIDAATRAEGLARTLAALDAYGTPACRVFVTLWRADAFLRVKEAARVAGFRCDTSFIAAVRRAALPGWCDVRRAVTLVRVASLLEVPACSIAAAASVVGASSPQALCRTARQAGCGPLAEWRRTATGADVLDAFVRGVVLAHRDAWRAFGPAERDATVTPTLLRGAA